MRIGIVCPYSWQVPGGVQAHVRDLAETLIGLGHSVAVLAPGDDSTPDLPPYVTIAGKAVPIPYNGSVARLQFGVMSAARVRRWLRDGEFDVVHVHEPAPPSLSLLTCMIHDGPLVATFHMATVRSRFLSTFDSVLQPFLEKITGRIAVSPAARQVLVQHLGGDAVVIPNGVAVAHFSRAQPLAGYPRPGGTVGFIGRFDEPRKGMGVLLDAVAAASSTLPDLQVLVAGRGDPEALLAGVGPEVASRIRMLGQVSESDKARLLRSVDVYCAPNTGQESFGIILLEAMAAGAPVIASDLGAFRRVLGEGSAGLMVPPGDAGALARALSSLIPDPQRRAELSRTASRAVAAFDWPVIAVDVLRVYELAVAGSPPQGGRPIT